MRRIVTGNDNEGHSVVVSDGAAPRSTEFTTLPGFSDTLVWATEPGSAIDKSGTDITPEVTSFVPGPGGSRLLVLSFPPDTVRERPEFDGSHRCGVLWCDAGLGGIIRAIRDPHNADN